MKKISLFLFVLLALAACAPAPLQTSEVSKTSEVSPSSTPTPPATPTRIATATATPKATKTPEPTRTPEVHMTLEDWKKVFDGSYIGNDGLKYELSDVFKYSDILTGQEAVERLDAIEKSGVTNSTSITTLDNGKITIISEPAFAKKMVKEKDASILVTKESIYPPAFHAQWVLGAARQDFQNGNHKITRIEFGEITSVTFSFNPPITLLVGSFFLPIKHMVDMPKHFMVRMTGNDNSLSLAGIGITDINPDDWVNTLVEEGVEYIDIFAQ